MLRSATEPARQFRAAAYPLAWRIIAGALVAVSRVSLLVILVSLLTAEGPVPLVALARVLTSLSLLPGVAAWLIERAFVVDVEVQDAPRERGRPGSGPNLLLRRGDRCIEIPYVSIARVVPWTLPLPGAGFSLWMRSGRRFRYGLQVGDCMPPLAALAEVGGVEK